MLCHTILTTHSIHTMSHTYHMLYHTTHCTYHTHARYHIYHTHITYSSDYIALYAILITHPTHIPYVSHTRIMHHMPHAPQPLLCITASPPQSHTFLCLQCPELVPVHTVDTALLCLGWPHPAAVALNADVCLSFPSCRMGMAQEASLSWAVVSLQ